MSTAIPILPEDSAVFGPERELVRRIAHSKHFARSPRLASLLEYLCEQSLTETSPRLTEQRIASQVFQRRGRFDPNEDTIVRSHMVRLRQKLALYFEEEGTDEVLRISIPRGGYTPQFEVWTPPDSQRREPRPSFSLPSDQKSSSVDPFLVEGGLPGRRFVHRLKGRYWIAGIAVLILTLIGTASSLWRSHHRPTTAGSDEFWAQMMPSGQPVLLIAADSSLVLLHHHMTHDTSLADYTSGRYLQDIKALQQAGVDTLGLEVRRYTSIVDLQLTRGLTQLAMEHKSAFDVRYPRDLTVEDLKRQNVVISGSRGANPWLELYEPIMNFKIYGIPERHLTLVSNRSPLPGESREYTADQSPDHVTYGVLAFLPGIDPSRSVLIIEGTSLSGTEAISDLLLNHKEMDSMLQAFRRPDGTISHFEILLSGEYVNGTSVRFKIMSSRRHP